MIRPEFINTGTCDIQGGIREHFDAGRDLLEPFLLARMTAAWGRLEHDRRSPASVTSLAEPRLEFEQVLGREWRADVEELRIRKRCVDERLDRTTWRLHDLLVPTITRSVGF